MCVYACHGTHGFDFRFAVETPVGTLIVVRQTKRFFSVFGAKRWTRCWFRRVPCSNPPPLPSCTFFTLIVVRPTASTKIWHRLTLSDSGHLSNFSAVFLTVVEVRQNLWKVHSVVKKNNNRRHLRCSPTRFHFFHFFLRFFRKFRFNDFGLTILVLEIQWKVSLANLLHINKNHIELYIKKK